MSDRQLLLIDVCGRLPYDFVIKGEYGNYVNINYYNAQIEHLLDRIVDGLDKLVLRPLSSMTAEEEIEFINLTDDFLKLGNKHYTILSLRQMDWLNKKGFDYRGLIPMGLTLPATEEMYK